MPKEHFMKRIIIIFCCQFLIFITYAQDVRLAEFPGGNDALDKFFRENENYTKDPKARKDFKVVAEVMIKEDGTAIFSKIIKPANTKERVVRQVKRLIKSMPAWRPALGKDVNGNTVAEKSFIELSIPFHRKFYLGESKTIISINKAGTLDELLTQMQKDTCSYLEIKGQMNSADILTLRRMAGGDGGHGRLAKLDMYDVRIVRDKSPYLTLEDAEKELIVDLCYISTYSPDRNGTQGVYTPNSYWPKSSFPIPQFQLSEEERGERTGPSWKSIRKYKIQRIKGHRLQKKDDGTYTYVAHTSRNNYCHDMFFRCPHIQSIVLPHRTCPQKHVQVIGHKVRCYY